MSKFAMLGAASGLALATASAAFAGEIDGRVTESTGVVGLEGALVRVVETGQQTRTERDGSFRITGLPAGSYTLRISYLGTGIREFALELPADDSEITTSFTLGDETAIRDNVLVIGQRGALTSALNQERAADGIISVLSADAIGRLPDENVAEAVRRSVGVNVLNDQGEGRFVSVRGIDPNLNAVSIGGVRATSPEADAREVPLDVIDSDILAGIIVTKSLTPDMDGDAIGGSIEVETISGLDYDDFFLRARAAGLYSDIAEEFGYRGSVSAAHNIGDRFGLAGSVSFQSREFGSDNMELDGDWDDGNAVPFPEQWELRDYRITRERLSVAFNADFEIDAQNRFFFRTLYSDFSDQEIRSRVENTFEDGDFDTANSSGNRFFVLGTNSDEYEVDRDLKDRLETQLIWTTQLGGEHNSGAFTIDWSVAFASAEEEEPNRIDTTFRGEFDSGSFGLDITDGITPTLIFGDAASSSAYYDASNYEFDDLELTNGLSRDNEVSGRFNLRVDQPLFGRPGHLQFGGVYRSRDKVYNLDLDVFDGFNAPAGFAGNSDLPLSDFLASPVTYGLDNIGPTPSATAIRDFFFANRGAFERHDFDSAVESNAADYRASENIWAGYFLGSMDFTNTRVVAGLRVEGTEYAARATQVLAAEEDATINGTQLADDTVFLSDVRSANNYVDYLPSINIRHGLSDEVVMRFAYYHSISRPNLEQAAPRVLIEQDDNDDVEAEYGNPDLQRAEARNADFSLAWYINRDSVLSGGVFWKSIDNTIAQIETANVVVNNIAVDEGTTFVNLNTADLVGFEINYQQSLDSMLPFDGVIVGANYTYVDSDVRLPDGRQIALPRQSQHVANLILGYDEGPWDVRLAMAYRDEYIDEVGLNGVDRVIDSHMQWDFSGEFDFTDQWRVFFEVKNINNEPFVALNRVANRNLNGQYEEYGWSGLFGVRFTR